VPSIADAKIASLGVSTRASLNSVALSTLGTGAIAAGFTINGHDIGALGAAANASDRASQLVTAINAVSAASGVTAVIDTTSNTIQLNSAADITLVDGPSTGAFGTLTATAAPTTGISSVDVLSTASASQALGTVDSALDTINSARGTLGALQSRFENAIGNIQVTAENLSAARGRIMDADFAAETANLSRAQILQQAGTAMVAQANQLPQQVLSLLK